MFNVSGGVCFDYTERVQRAFMEFYDDDVAQKISDRFKLTSTFQIPLPHSSGWHFADPGLQV